MLLWSVKTTNIWTKFIHTHISYVFWGLGFEDGNQGRSCFGTRCLGPPAMEPAVGRIRRTIPPWEYSRSTTGSPLESARGHKTLRWERGGEAQIWFQCSRLPSSPPSTSDSGHRSFLSFPSDLSSLSTEFRAMASLPFFSKPSECQLSGLILREFLSTPSGSSHLICSTQTRGPSSRNSAISNRKRNKQSDITFHSVYRDINKTCPSAR